MKDPIVEKVRKARFAFAKRLGDDPQAMIKELNRLRQLAGNPTHFSYADHINSHPHKKSNRSDKRLIKRS